MRWDLTNTKRDNKIQIGKNSKPRFFNFIKFLSLIVKSWCYQWVNTLILIKINLIIDKEKKF